MARSDDLIRERSEYYAFKERVSVLVGMISQSVSDYESPSKRIYDAYQINGEHGDYGKIQVNINNLKTLGDSLNSGTIPAIDAKIDQLSAAIQSAIEEEEEERRRAEEEAREAAQQSASSGN